MKKLQEFENPKAACDVEIHEEETVYLYRVAIFGNLDREWLEEWKKTFMVSMSIDDRSLDEHCANIARTLHGLPSPRYLIGYGPVGWIDHNWRIIDILDRSSDRVGEALVKLISAGSFTNKNDVVEFYPIEWEVNLESEDLDE